MFGNHVSILKKPDFAAATRNFGLKYGIVWGVTIRS
jgi:hypothetical protein